MAIPAEEYRVLLIESDARESEICSDLIREVIDCRIDIVSRLSGSFDWLEGADHHLVVVDLGSIDREGGLSFLEQIKRISPSTGVILFSAEASVEEAVQAIRLGAEDYLKKPFDPEAFKLAVKRSLDRKAVFGEQGGASGILNLMYASQMISASLDQSKVFAIIRGYFARELKTNYSSIYMLKDCQPVRIDEPDAATQGGADGDQAVSEILDIAVYSSNPFQKMIESGETCRFVARAQLTPAYFVFRFKCAYPEDIFYVALSPQLSTSEEAFISQVGILKAQIELTGKNIRQYMGVQHLVYVDDATGLYNTRYMNTLLDREIEQAKKHNRSFAVLFIDADRFKGINDTHGHLVGTKLLNELGKHLKKFVRASDTVFRYGGDEFIAVLSPCDLETAKGVAERIRQSVEKTQFLSDEGLDVRFTVSIGVSLFTRDTGTRKAVIAAADHAMYEAKKLSRNAVYVAKLSEPGAAESSERDDSSGSEGRDERSGAGAGGGDAGQSNSGVPVLRAVDAEAAEALAEVVSKRSINPKRKVK